VLLIPKRHRQTDGRTDRQTDGRLTVALPRSALASRGKNGIILLIFRYGLRFVGNYRNLFPSTRCEEEKKGKRYSSPEQVILVTHLRATRRHLPYGITQYYLTHDTSELDPPNPSQTGWY